MATITATSSGMCSACFNRYRAGTKLVLDPTGKVRHVSCGHANMVASAAERRVTRPSTYRHHAQSSGLPRL